MQTQCWGSSAVGESWIRGSRIHDFSKYENENGGCHPSRSSEKK